MSIAISLKVNDGVVLASDSASSIMVSDGPDADNRRFVVNVYNNADKVFNLYKSLPIGMVTWGAGSIADSSLATLTKDFRRSLQGASDQSQQAQFDAEDYTVEGVATELRDFVAHAYEEEYESNDDIPEAANIGFIVAGYSSRTSIPEEYRISVIRGQPGDPELIREGEEVGITWGGEPAAISRLVNGVDNRIGDVLRQNLGVPDDEIDAAVAVIRRALGQPLVHAAMPVQDAIDLARFLVEATIRFSRFSPGAPTVGGPIDIAAITKHEGFKWIDRKHYYDRALNPED